MVCVKGIGKDHAKFSPVGEPNSLHLTLDVPREEMVIHFPSISSYSLLPTAPRDHAHSTSDGAPGQETSQVLSKGCYSSCGGGGW